MKIGVIGATGMIGHHTARAVMTAGHDLVVIHRKGSRLDRLEDLLFSGRIADLNDRESLFLALKGLDAVIHCAAYYPTVPRPLLEEMNTASQQMHDFLDACETHNLQKIVYLGGSIAIPKRKDGKPANETDSFESSPPNKAPYVQVKWIMDKIARDRAEDGLPIVIGIPGMTFGEFDYGPSTGQLLVHIANRTLPAYVRGNRNIIYAGDAGTGLVQACLKGRPGHRYLLTGTNISMDELVATAAEIAGVQVPGRVLSLGQARLISRLLETKYRLFGGKPPLLNATAIAVMAAGQFLDGSKAREELSFTPTVGAHEMISRAIQWFRKEEYIYAKKA